MRSPIFLQLGPSWDADCESPHTRRDPNWNLVSFYRSEFCHHILFLNQITPIHHFLFIMNAFRLISNTNLLFRRKSMSLRNKIFMSFGTYAYNKSSFIAQEFQFQRQHHKCWVNIFPKYWEILKKALVVPVWMLQLDRRFNSKFAFYSITANRILSSYFIGPSTRASMNLKKDLIVNADL